MQDVREIPNIDEIKKNIRKYFDDYCVAYGIDDMRSQRQPVFNGAMQYIYNNYIRPSNVLKDIPKNVVDNSINQMLTNYNAYNIDLLYEVYLYLRELANAYDMTATADIEAFNYYTVAFNKVGKEWGKDFEKFGYDNAEDYAQSFGNRVNELLGKMSGLKVDVDGGLISESGTKNLGLNLQEITQYASQLASITNSLGQTGEVTTAISKSMTMLAGDISSLFNVDFSTVATNLQSGLIGQSRALYKYGIDITNATLQTYAYKYGIEKAVSEMSQAEKQQLRLLAILDQSKVSWGDLANTINSPSNMIRQFTNNVNALFPYLYER